MRGLVRKGFVCTLNSKSYDWHLRRVRRILIHHRLQSNSRLVLTSN